MQRTLIHAVLVGFALFWMTGCATILGGGSSETVYFESDPSGANVIIDGVNRGKTPTSVKLEKKESYVVKMEKECYTHDKMYVSRQIQMGWTVADYIFALPTLGLSVGIDYLTGAWYSLDKNRLSAKLENTCNGGESSGGKGEAAETEGKKEEAADSECKEGAKEYCDNKDNDCDGVVDEGCR